MEVLGEGFFISTMSLLLLGFVMVVAAGWVSYGLA